MVTTNLDSKGIKKKNVHDTSPRLDELSLSRKYSSNQITKKEPKSDAVCQNLTGMTYLQFFGHNASS